MRKCVNALLRRKAAFALVFLGALCVLGGEEALAQTPGEATVIRYGAALPSGAANWSVFTLTNGTGLYQCQHAPSCTSSGQWVAVGSGGGGSAVFPSWAATTAYAANAYVIPASPNGHYYKNTAGACTSGGSAPTWPTGGGSVADNTCTWQDQGAAAGTGAGVYVNKAGDTMTGPLTLAGDPVTSTQASTRNYVDVAVSGRASLALDNLASVNISTAQIGITQGLFYYNTDASQDFDSQTHRPKSAYFANNVFAGSASGSVGGFLDIAATATPTTQNGASWHGEGPYNATSAQSSSGTFAIVVGTPPAGTPAIMYSVNGGGSQTVAAINSNTTGQAGTALALAAMPTQCGGNTVATGVQANGNANCSSSNVINLQETTSQTGASGYGAIWFGADHLLHANDGGSNISLGAYSDLSNTLLGVANANTLEISNGVNSQALYLYQTTDNTNYSRMGLAYDAGSTDFVLSSSWGGSGSSHPLGFGVGSGSTVRWEIPAGSPYQLRPSLAGGATNTEDIGDATHQVRNLYLGTGFYIGTVQVTGMTSTLSGNLMTAGTVAGSSKVLCTDNAGNLTLTTSSCAVTAAQLPNPSSSTLGGVESYAAVSHQWINQISTSGVPSSTQPAFSDISGSVAAGQLPNPSSSTLGGVESIVSTSHQWVAYIDTGGVPHQSQPTLADVAAGAAPSGTFDFTGATPKVPTASAGDNSTNAASTAYVKSETQFTFACPLAGAGATVQYCNWTLPAAITVTGFDLALGTAPLTCSPYATVQVWDGTAAAEVGSYSITMTSATNFYSQVTGSTNVASGHLLRVKVTTAAAGCGTTAAGIVATITYQMQN